MSERSESNASNCSAEFCQSLPPGMEKIMAFVRRREWLQDNAPYCPECGDGWQQQLVDHVFSKTAKWKCRICGHRYEKEPHKKFHQSS